MKRMVMGVVVVAGIAVAMWWWWPEAKPGASHPEAAGVTVAEPGTTATERVAPPAAVAASTPSRTTGSASLPAPAGARAVARVTAGNRTVVREPNQVGQFPRIHVEPKEVVALAVTFPEGEAGEPVVVGVEDGGKLDGDVSAGLWKLDAERVLRVGYTVSESAGIHRVVMRRGAERKVLEFWAGEELPLARN